MLKRILKTILIIGTVVSIFFFFSCNRTKRTESSSRRLYLFNWTYYTPDEIIDRFEKEFNVKVILDNYASNEELYTKLKASRSGYDIVIPSADYTSIMIKQDMLLPLDHLKLPNLKYIEEKAR